MRLVKRILRPLYRRVVERPLWWFLAKVKVFWLAEIGAQIEQIAQRMVSIDQRLTVAEASNAAQWNALEQLLLAVLRQPEARSDLQWNPDPPEAAVPASTAERELMNERNNLR